MPRPAPLRRAIGAVRSRSGADRVTARGSRSRRATSPHHPFHGHVRGQRAPAPFLLLVPHDLLRGNVPRDRLRGLRPRRAMSRPSEVARPRVHWRTLSLAPPLGPRAQRGPTWRFGGLVRKGASLADADAALFATRSIKPSFITNTKEKPQQSSTRRILFPCLETRYLTLQNH